MSKLDQTYSIKIGYIYRQYFCKMIIRLLNVALQETKSSYSKLFSYLQL